MSQTGEVAAEGEMRWEQETACGRPYMSLPRTVAFLSKATRCLDQLCRTKKDKASLRGLTACTQKLQAWQVPLPPSQERAGPETPPPVQVAAKCFPDPSEEPL